MSPSTRVRLAVGLAAAAAGAVVAAVVLATGQDPPQPKVQCKQAPQALIVAGVGNPQAVSEVRSAFARWPHGTVERLEALTVRYPRDPVVQFNYGSALFCRGYVADAEQAFRAAKSTGRDTRYEITADNILHPEFFQGGYPIFEPTRPEPLLLRGVALQREGRQHSAEKLYARAARLRPGDAEAQVAAAVGRFDEDRIAASFSRLGPLTRRFPRSQSVRYHLALLLSWTGQGDQAIKQFRLARTLGPSTALGREANAFLQRLAPAGSGSAKR